MHTTASAGGVYITCVAGEEIDRFQDKPQNGIGGDNDCSYFDYLQGGVSHNVVTKLHHLFHVCVVLHRYNTRVDPFVTEKRNRSLQQSVYLLKNRTVTDPLLQNCSYSAPPSSEK